MILRDSLANALGNLLRIILAIISVPILVKCLGLGSYGHLSILLAIINIGTLAEMGLGTSATIHLARCLHNQQREKARRIAGYVISLALIFSGIAAVGLVIVTPLLGQWVFKDVHETAGLTVPLAVTFAAISIVFKTCFQVFIAMLHGARRFVVASALQTTWFYLMQGGLITAALFTTKLSILTGIVAIASLLSTLAAWHYIRSYYGPIYVQLPRDQALTRNLLATALNIGAINISNSLFSQADKVVAGAFLSARLTGIYCTFATIAGQINIIGSALSQPTIAYLARLPVEDWQERMKTYKWSFRMTAIAIVLMTTGIILTKEYVIPIIFPAIASKYFGSLGLLALSYGLFSLNAPAYYALQAIGQGAYVRNVVMFAGALSLGSMGVLAYAFGLDGIVWGSFAFCIIVLLTRRIIAELRIEFANVWEVGIAAFLMISTAVLSATTRSIFVRGLVFASVFTVAGIFAVGALQRHQPEESDRG